MQDLGILSKKKKIKDDHNMAWPSQTVAATGRPTHAEAEPSLCTSCDNKVQSVWVCMAIQW